jgi:hypothetical protein
MSGPGLRLFENVVPLTTAASPLVSGWMDTTGFTSMLPYFTFTGGVTAFTVEGSFDGATQDPDITYSAPVSGTAMDVKHAYVRFRLVQTTANATVTKCFVQSRW